MGYLQHGRRHMPGGTDPIPNLGSFLPSFAFGALEDTASVGGTVWDFDEVRSDSFGTVFGNQEGGFDPDATPRQAIWILQKGLYLATLYHTWDVDGPPADYPVFDEKGNRFDAVLSVSNINDFTWSEMYAPVTQVGIFGSASPRYWVVFTVDKYITVDEEDVETESDAAGHVAVEVSTSVGLVGEPDPDPRDFNSRVIVYRLADLPTDFGPGLPDIWPAA